MKKATIRKAGIAALSIMFLVSTGAMAATKHKCKKGQHWDVTAKMCVKK
ncbi:MAG: hypothetical protein HYX63_21675 [Gammaproteobacteria bacterium]|nr:hypothetical protein [Gammaproteobacteria bacterium]